MTANQAPLTVVTYNVHRCRGTDRRYDPGRIAQLLREMKADIIGLQEVDTGQMVPLCERRHDHVHKRFRRDDRSPEALPPGDETCGDMHQLDFLSRETGYHAVEGLVRTCEGGQFGNALLTPHEILDVRRIDLSVRGCRERRGALDVKLRIRGHPVRVLVAHLGLQIWERYFQIARLLKALGQDRTEQIIIMGDFNLLVSVLPKLRRFYRRIGHAPLVRTFPSRFPLLSLDRIWVQPARALTKVERYESPLSRVASDHLPLVGTVLLDR